MTICHVDRRIKGKLSITDDLSVNGHISGTDASLTNLTVNGTFSSGTFSGLSSTDDVTFNSLDTEFVTLKYQVSDASSGTLNFESNIPKYNSGGGIEYFYNAKISQIKSVVQDDTGGELQFFTRDVDGSLNSTFKINNEGRVIIDGGGQDPSNLMYEYPAPIDPSDLPMVHIIAKKPAYDISYIISQQSGNYLLPNESDKNEIALRLDGNLEIYSDNFASDGDPATGTGAIRVMGRTWTGEENEDYNNMELLISHESIMVREKYQGTNVYKPDNTLYINTGTEDTKGKVRISGKASILGKTTLYDGFEVADGSSSFIGTTSFQNNVDISGQLHINTTLDAAPNTNNTGALLIGDITNANMAIDSNEIMARDGTGAGTLFLQHQGGGTIKCGNGNGIQFQVRCSDSQPQLRIYPEVNDTANNDLEWVELGPDGTGGQGVLKNTGYRFIIHLNTRDNHTDRFLYYTSSYSYGVTNTCHLGVSGRRWKSLWVQNGNVTGSDVRDKKDIHNLDLGLGFINKLRPIDFIWNDRSGFVGERKHLGFIAQEVKEVLGENASEYSLWCHNEANTKFDTEEADEDAVTENFDRQSLRMTEFIAPMVKAIQELSARLTALEQQLNN